MSMARENYLSSSSTLLVIVSHIVSVSYGPNVGSSCTQHPSLPNLRSKLARKLLIQASKHVINIQLFITQ